MGQPKSYGAGAVASWNSKPPTNLSLPSKIKCCRCSRVKGPAAYAKTRQEDLKGEMGRKGGTYNASVTAFIPCMECTGAQVTELFCNGCDKWKGLNSFSKAQRRTPDKAKCWPCMEEQLNTEPGGDSSGSDSNSSNSDDDSDDSYLGGGTTVPSVGMSGLSITNDGTSEAGGVAITSPSPSTVGKSTPSQLQKSSSNTSTSRFTPHARKAAPTANTGFANFPKIKAAPRSIYMDTAQQERNREKKAEEDLDNREVASSESSSDDDED